MIHFSPTTGGFYDDKIHAVIPPDARLIQKSAHVELLEAQANGKTIVADANGDPVAVDPAVSSSDLLRFLRDERTRLLAASDYTQLPDANLTDDQRKAWCAYRQALRDLPAKIANPSSVEWPIAPASS